MSAPATTAWAMSATGGSALSISGAPHEDLRGLLQQLGEVPALIVRERGQPRRRRRRGRLGHGGHGGRGRHGHRRYRRYWSWGYRRGRRRRRLLVRAPGGGGGGPAAHRGVEVVDEEGPGRGAKS